MHACPHVWGLRLLAARPAAAALAFLAFTGPAVWIRVLVLTGGLLAVMVLVLRQLFVALQRSEAFKQAILDSVTAHIAVLDHRGVIVAINRPWTRFAAENSTAAVEPARTGIGTNYLEICRADRSETAGAAMAAHDGIVAVLEGRAPSVTLEYRCETAAGPRWFTLVATRLEIPGRFLVVSHTDITERKRAEQTLRDSEARLAKVFHSSPVGINIFRLSDGVSLEMNDAFLEIVGYSRAELIGRTATDLNLFPEPAVAEARRQALREGRAVRHQDLQIRRKSGEIRDVLDSVEVTEVDGEPMGLAFASDITERKRTERAQRAGEARFRAMFELASIGMARSDPQTGRLLQVNQKLCDITGFPEAELLQLRFPEITHPDDRDREWGVFQRMTLGELRDYRLEKRYIRRDGTVRWVNVNATVVRGPAGEPTSTIATIEDITEKKLLETQALRTQRLEAIGTLSSGIAHDLNNILAPMLMASGLLREALTHRDDRELMQLIESSAQRGAAIIRQLLTFSRGIEGERVAVPVRPLIREMAGIVRETFPRNIRLGEAVGDDLWPVLADTTQLHQVLMNLCVNARDAMAEGGDLTIAAENMPVVAQPPRPPEQAHPGPYVLITVRDTGCGIRADVLDRIFEPFFTTKGVGQGTGLGLSTALGIVRSHKGFITVESEPGRGSAFRVYLPAVPEALVTRAGVPARAKPAVGRNETILVVDDEPSILITVRHSLEGAGYRVLTAADGREALGLFQEHAGLIRLVVTDVMMPVMDGLKLARALRQCDAGIRVIACSGLDQDLKSTELEEGIIVDFLSKPYERATLLGAVRRHLGAEPS